MIKYIIAIVIIGALAFGGWHLYQKHTAEEAMLPEQAPVTTQAE